MAQAGMKQGRDATPSKLSVVREPGALAGACARVCVWVGGCVCVGVCVCVCARALANG